MVTVKVPKGVVRELVLMVTAEEAPLAPGTGFCGEKPQTEPAGKPEQVPGASANREIGGPRDRAD